LDGSRTKLRQDQGTAADRGPKRKQTRGIGKYGLREYRTKKKKGEPRILRERGFKGVSGQPNFQGRSPPKGDRLP
jgi:hypothetical protein